MKFFPKEIQPIGFRKETSGHQENHCMRWKRKKNTHKIVIHLYTPVQIVGQNQKNIEKEMLALFPSGRSDLGWWSHPWSLTASGTKAGVSWG